MLESIKVHTRTICIIKLMQGRKKNRGHYFYIEWESGLSQHIDKGKASK